MNRKLLTDLIGLELIALVVVIGYKMSPILLPKADLTALPDPACDLQKQACAASLPSGGSIKLSLGNRPVPLVKPFAVEVVAKGIQPARIAVDFSGVEMNMGYNRPELQPSGAGRFVGEATLPVCITGQMDWQATVLVEAGSQRIAVPFRFTTGEHQ